MSGFNNAPGFDMFVNVDIKVVEHDTNTIKKHITKHNKATRNMIKGILRFLEGKFTSTYENSEAEYKDDAKNYIPCYISFGDGGVIYNNEGVPEQETEDVSDSDHIPKLNDWSTYVDYNSTQLVREFSNLSMRRSKVRKQADTLELDPAGDMDTIVLYCETSPGEVNFDIVDGQGQPMPRFVTEVGLFSNFEKSENDLLAYVKLSNEKVEGMWKTDTLYVRPGDTIIITWYITVVAISDLSVVDSSEELVQPLIGEIEFSEQ